MGDRREQFEKCRHEWVPTSTPAAHGQTGRPGRTVGTRCLHCGRYSYRPSPPAEPHRPAAR